MFITGITSIARERGMIATEIKIYQANCWQHLHNVWIVTVIKYLGKHMDEVINTDLRKIHFLLRFTTDIGNLMMAVKKYFGMQANYAKMRLKL